jgi:hypothetical protein
MSETVYITGVVDNNPVVINGSTIEPQVIINGTVAVAGPPGPAGRDGVDGTGGGSSTWGVISGDITDQTDLQTALSAKLTKTSNLADVANPAQARTNLGVAIGTDVQAQLPAGSTTDYIRGDKTVQNFNTAVRTNRLNELASPNAPVSMAGQRLTGLVNPVQSQDAATKAYVDATAEGLSVKDSVIVATTAALPANTYTAGVLTASANGALTVDGVAVVADDRVLVKDEAAGANNGIYEVTNPGDGSHPYVLARAPDMDASSEIKGAFTFVIAGTSNANIGYIVNTTGAITLGSTPLTFVQFSNSTTPDATAIVKGKIQLAGDLGGPANAPTTPTAVHITGAETIAGVKTFTDAPVLPSGSLPESVIVNLVTHLAAKADLASPALTGTPTAPTASAGTNTTQLATTAFVQNAVASLDDVASYPAATSFPATGMNDTIYVANDTSYLYRWSGSAYVQVGGSTDATTTSKGIVKLAGDIGGSAALPLVKRVSRFIVAPYGDTRPCDYQATSPDQDDVAVRAAMAAAYALPTGGVVDLLDGTFVFAARIDRLPNVHVHGRGRYVTKVTTVANASFNIWDMDKVTYNSSNPLLNSQITDMEIDGSNMAPGSEKKAINGGNFKNCIIARLYVHDTTATGIGDDDFYGTHIDDCIVENCGYENKHLITAASWASNVFTFQTADAHGYTAWTAASGTLTASGTVNDADTVTIDSVVYTFKTTLTGAAFEVLINGSAANALTNLKKAVNLSGVAATDYGTGTTKHPTVAGGALTSTTLLMTANNIGTAGNSYGTTDTGANLSWSASTLTGGATGNKIVINGMVPELYNGTFNVTSVTDSTHFTISAVTNSSGLNFTINPGTPTAYGSTSDSILGHNGIGIASGALGAELCLVTNCICINNQNNNFLIEADNNNSADEVFYAFTNCLSVGAGGVGFRNTGSMNAQFNNCFDFGSTIGGTAVAVASSKTIIAASWSGGVATFQTSAAVLFSAGDFVTISGMVPDAYNGYYTVSTVPDTTHFTVAMTSDPGTAVRMGSSAFMVHRVEGTSFNNSIFAYNLNYGLQLPDDGVILNTPIVHHSYNYGIQLSSTSNSRILEAKVHDNGRQGIQVVMGSGIYQPMDHLTITGHIYNNGKRFSNCDGIDIDPSATSAAIQNLSIDVHAFDNQTVKTQRYGVILRSGGTISNAQIRGNLSGNATGPILLQNTGSSIYVNDVIGVNPRGEVDLGNVTGSVTFDTSTGDVFTATLTGNITPVMSTPYVKGARMTWVLIQDGTGSRTMTLPANATTGSTLTLSTVAGTVDVLTWTYDGNGGKWRLISKNLGANSVGTLNNLAVTSPNSNNTIAANITQNDTTNNPDALDLTNAGTANALKIAQNGILAASKYGFFLDTSAAQVNAPLARMRVNNASATQATLQLDNSGTGVALNINTGGMQITAGNLNLSGGANVAPSTVTGTKFATATNQKMAWWNATPVVQPSGNALTALSTIGLVASPTLAESDVTNLTSDLAGKVALSTVTTKGDLLVGTASATIARQAVGSNGQVLTADSTQTNGVKWASPTTGLGYVLNATAVNLSPADATTYFFGSSYGQGASTTGGQLRIYIPKAGTINTVYVYFFNATANGSAETSTISLRLNNTTDTSISAAVTNSAQATVVSNAAMGLAVAAGDYIELKWASPTWVTNPTGVRVSATIYVE